MKLSNIGKKISSVLFAVVFAAGVLTGCGNGKAADLSDVTVNVSVLKGPTAMGMVKLMKDSEDTEFEGPQYNFAIAASADEITPSLVQGEIDIAAVPANLASVLYNNTEGEIQVLAVNTLGVLYIIENGTSVNSVSDLAGKTIYASGKGATPEYALDFILRSNGLDPETDVNIEWKSEHTECLSALLADGNGIAMLPQPFVTVAQKKAQDLRVALDLTEEWNKAEEASGGESALVTGVLVVRKEFAEANPEVIEAFLEEYSESVAYTNENIADAAALVGEYDIVTAEIAEKAIPECNIVCITGDEMKAKLAGYLEELYNLNPAAVGGTLPGEDFYY